MKTPLFTGSSVAIVTPMHPDKSIHLEKLGELIDLQLAGGTAAITVCGTTGESALLSDDEKLAVIRYAVEHTAGRVPVIAGTGSNDTSHALALSREAQACGADGLLLVTPYYNKCSAKGLIRHYTTIADQVDIPCIVYNIPSRTGVSMSVPVYRELSRHPRINGIKEASGSTELVRCTLAACDLNVWSGNDSQIVPLMALGAKGVISVLANLLPAQTAQLAGACLAGDYAKAASMQLAYGALIDALFCEVNPIPIKTALNLMGMEVGPLRMPLCEMEPEQEALLRQAMAAASIPLKQPSSA